MDPYFAGALTPFVLTNFRPERYLHSSDSSVFLVHDRYCSLPQLYDIHRLYKEYKPNQYIRPVQYSNVAYFDCDLKWVVLCWMETFLKDPEQHPEIFWRYLTGIVDTSSEIIKDKDDLCIRLFGTLSFLVGILERVGIPGLIKQTASDCYLEYTSVHATDFYGKLIGPSRFKQSDFNLIMTGKTLLPECYVQRLHPDAIFPVKKQLSEMGHPLYLVSKLPTAPDGLYRFDTGLSVEIPLRYYIEIVPSPELLLNGYMLARNRVERSQQGRLIIELVHFFPEPPELPLPFCCGHVVFRRQHFVDLVEIES